MFSFEQTRVSSFGTLAFTVEAMCAMDGIKIPDFPHRIHPDGTYESICILCLATVATARDLAELYARHKGHVCEPVDWAHDYLPNYPS
jgi:hypothetical protein